MMADSGSPFTLLSETKWDELFKSQGLILSQSLIQPIGYGGKSIDVIGEFNAELKFKNNATSVTIYLAKDDACLLGSRAVVTHYSQQNENVNVGETVGGRRLEWEVREKKLHAACQGVVDVRRQLRQAGRPDSEEGLIAHRQELQGTRTVLVRCREVTKSQGGRGATVGSPECCRGITRCRASLRLLQALEKEGRTPVGLSVTRDSWPRLAGGPRDPPLQRDMQGCVENGQQPAPTWGTQRIGGPGPAVLFFCGCLGDSLEKQASFLGTGRQALKEARKLDNVEDGEEAERI
ncbi:hypothetical protein NDU88_001184 [Pleurodeles waltl]|uniref:Peptidase A2 domain-containing protein n=1 Tax=Pleurodeles waltl TaxID=8319 RepID=A0AAV7US26_PLEWA|nr:hypothetical protein NDU88_001184 [Pleurodeles waltl]